jgi:ribosomal protein RSM22 (predicted rRNA methylase)
MPATYAAAHSVLGEVRARVGPAGSILDAGAGTGAAALAARAHFPESAITLVERDPDFAAAARVWLPEATLIAALVLIEPGTPRGFALIRKVRRELLAAGARMVAPCPAETECPMADPDWCHFAARVERTSLHRRIKGGELGYEDEKFSYVALARSAVELAEARIIRHPQHRPGSIEIETCTAGGLSSERIFKRDRDRFRAARKAAWGDAGIS